MAERGEQGQGSVLSVLLAHPDRLLREGIADILERGGCTVAAQTDSASELREFVARIDADVILLDLGMSDVDPGLVSYLDGTCRGYVAFLTRPEHHDPLLRTAEAGARGYLSTNLAPEEFVECVRMLGKGNVVISRDLFRAFRSELADDEGAAHQSLSEREQEVVRLVGLGASNREIAQTLIISEHTVKVHLRSVLNKLNLRNRQQIAAYAAQTGVVLEHEVGDTASP